MPIIVLCSLYSKEMEAVSIIDTQYSTKIYSDFSRIYRDLDQVDNSCSIDAFNDPAEATGAC